MSAAPSIPRPPRATILWTAAAAVLVHAIVHRWVGERSLWHTAIFADVLATLPLLSGLRGRRRAEIMQDLCAPGVAAAAVALVAEFALTPLAAWIDGAVPLHALLLVAIALIALLSGGTAGRLRTLIGVEWLKLTRGRLLRVGLLVAAAATMLAAVMHTPVKEETTGWTQAAGSLGSGFWTAEILLFVLGATSIAGEISQGTMKMILPYAYRRAEWISAKAIVLLFAAALFAVVVCVAGIGYAAFDVGLGDVTKVAPAGFGLPDSTELHEPAAAMRERLLTTIGASAASIGTSAVVGLLLSCVFGGLVAALSASFLLFVVLKAGTAFFGLTTETLSMIYAHYPDKLRGWTEEFGKVFNAPWDGDVLLAGLHLAMITGGVALLLALRMFGRRDLHG